MRVRDERARWVDVVWFFGIPILIVATMAGIAYLLATGVH